MNILLAIALFTAVLPGSVFADSEVFQYQLLKTDPTRFHNGYGHLKENSPTTSMAVTLEKTVKGARSHLQMAIYGIYKQRWFTETLSSLPQKVNIRAVVDQRSGQLGDWNPIHFTYPDTPDLPKSLGEHKVLPDLTRSERVRTSTIMHNKFLVVDHSKVWMGSANFSLTGVGLGYNANTVLVLDSKQLAKIFAGEFDQMFKSRRFSRTKLALPEQERKISYQDGTSVEVFFSPQDPIIEEGILPLLQDAKQTIEIAMFYLTEKRIIETLYQQAKAGIEVRIILDALAARHPSSPVEYLREAGVKLRVENWGGKMHMKTALIDSNIVVTGSMNWSEAGSKKNDESTLIIKNPALSQDIQNYFNFLWNSIPPVKNRSLSASRWSDPGAESLASKNSCFDGIDNDYDGRKDSQDSGCRIYEKDSEQEARKELQNLTTLSQPSIF